MKKMKKIFIVYLSILISGISFTFAQQSNNFNKIKIFKGPITISKTEKIGKQVLKIENVQILISNTAIKNVYRNSKNIIISFNNNETVSITENTVNFLHTKTIILKNNQIFNLEKLQNTNSFLITTSHKNKAKLEIQDINSSGEERNFLIKSGSAIELNKKTIKAIDSTIIIESQGRSLKLKKGHIITTNNVILKETQNTKKSDTTKSFLIKNENITNRIDNNSNILNTITVSKGFAKISNIHKLKKQVLTLGNVTIFINNFYIKTFYKKSSSIILTLHNNQTISVFENKINLLTNKTIILKNGQSLHLQPCQNNSILISTTKTNKTIVKIEDIDSYGQKRIFFLDKGAEIELNNNNSITVVKGKIIFESNGKLLELKKGNMLSANNVISTINLEIKKPKTTQDSKKNIIIPREEPTDFNNDLFDFSPTKKRITL